METIEIVDAIEALEEFGYECRRENGRLIVDHGGITSAILAEPVLLEMVSKLIEIRVS